MTDTTPTAISQFIHATNNTDPDAFLDSFAADATLEDWGRSFTGRDQIAAWNRTDNMGVHSHLDLVDLRPGSAPDSYAATVKVTGNGYNGTGTMTFTLHGGLIASLLIS